MSRLLLCGAMMALLSLPVHAERTVTPTETVIRLSVSPMPAPKPALRYSLLPEMKELSPGNPVQNYTKYLLSLDAFKIGKATPAELRQADVAARLDKPDWQMLQRLKTEGEGLLITDVTTFRVVIGELKERFQTEITEDRLDDALVTAKTMFAMSRHLGEHPTIIGNFVGISLVTVTINTFEEMLERENCPNFYWALTNLPAPFISFEKGIEGERTLSWSEFNDLTDAAPMNSEHIKKLILHIDKLQKINLGKPEAEVRQLINARANDPAYLVGARKRLADYGISPELLKQFPVEQIIFLDERIESEIRQDDYMKLSKLPNWQAEEAMAKLPKPKEPAIFEVVAPTQMAAVFRAQGRLEQRIALLRHVEALRIYVAEHKGKLPVVLADFTVPLPNDPVTGNAFRYWIEGNTAHLRGTPAPTTEKISIHNIHYQITFRNKQ